MQTVTANKSFEHFICMLYCIMNNCISLREVTHSIAALWRQAKLFGSKYTHLSALVAMPIAKEYTPNFTAIIKALRPFQ